MSYREDQLWQGLRFGVLQAEGQKITRSRKSLGGTKSQAENHGGGGGRKSPGCFIHPCACLERVTWTSIIYIH